MKVLTVAGARPNFVKIAPLIKVMRRSKGLAPVLVNMVLQEDPDAVYADALGIAEFPVDYLGVEIAPDSHVRGRV